MSGGPLKAPRFWRWLLTIVVPAAEREFVVGDLDEEFNRMPAGGRARRWYRSQAIRSSAESMRDRLTPDRSATSATLATALARSLERPITYSLISTGMPISSTQAR